MSMANKLTDKMNAWNAFVQSNWFLALLGVFVLATWWSNMTVAGIVVLLVLLAVILVTCRNTAPAMAVILFIYFTFSPQYSTLKGNEWMLALLVLPVAAIVTHILLYRPRLRIRGFGVAVAVSTVPWLLQGVVRRIVYSATDYFSPTFVWVAYVVVAGLGGLYLLAYLLFDATCTGPDFAEYLCKVMVLSAAVIVAQCVVFTVRLVLQSSLSQLIRQIADGAKPIMLGWGSNNNVAAYLSLTIPITLYYAQKSTRLSAVMFLFAVVQYGTLLLTFSRGPMLFVTAGIPFMLVYLFVRSNNRQRVAYAAVLGVCLVFVVVLAVVYRDMVAAFVQHLATKKLDDSGRHYIWQNAIDTFKQYPVFGGGMDIYYYTDTAPWAPADPMVADNPFFFNRPGVPRWFHGTLWQIMAAFGSVGLVAYAYQYAYRYALMWRMRTSRRQLWVLWGMVLFELYGLIDINFLSPIMYFIILLLTMGADKQGDYRPIMPLIRWLPRRVQEALQLAGTREPDDL